MDCEFLQILYYFTHSYEILLKNVGSWFTIPLAMLISDPTFRPCTADRIPALMTRPRECTGS